MYILLNFLFEVEPVNCRTPCVLNLVSASISDLVKGFLFDNLTKVHEQLLGNHAFPKSQMKISFSIEILY